MDKETKMTESGGKSAPGPGSAKELGDAPEGEAIVEVLGGSRES